MPHLNLYKEGCQHESQGATVNDQSEATDHKPCEDPPDDPVLPTRGQAAEGLVQGVGGLVLPDLLGDVLIDGRSVVRVAGVGCSLKRLRLGL